ncbi:hypothetical protein MLD38_006438 [Melastoma candidum]|uniref:Uncharacterized protein n=1 Tax=Melastoma candidum TaxID=119954 RepID=A0ACB9RS22_9MYRT|nr:hypothetical protein MLD38_006438 [Melastoma candidum]
MESERNKPANYVLVSNFYAAVGRWDIVDEVRHWIKEKGQVKEAWSSWFCANTSPENNVKSEVYGPRWRFGTWVLLRRRFIDLGFWEFVLVPLVAVGLVRSYDP